MQSPMQRTTRLAAATVLAATSATLVVTALGGTAHAATGSTAASVVPSSGPRTPSDPAAQLTTGMMPADSPDAVVHDAPGARNAHAARAVTSYLNGIDVASYQHGSPISWSSVKAAGQTYVVVKATESTTYANSYEPADVAGARAAGLRVGLYHFARPSLQNGSPTADAVAEADWFSAKVNAVTGAQLPPTLDLETNGGLTPAQLVAWTSAFLTRVQADTGRRPMIYTGPYFWNTNVQSTAFTSYPLWEAHYTAAASPQVFGGWPSYTFWQWSDGADQPAVSGISGSVDRDRYPGAMAGLLGVEAASSGVSAPFLGTATAAQLPNGTLVQQAGTHEVYVVAGLAPVYLTTFSGYPGNHQVRQISAAQMYSLRSTPADGTFLNAVPSGRVFQVVGGAPVYVTSWKPFGSQPVVAVSDAAIDRAGEAGVLSHLAARPHDGTFVTTPEDGRVYVVAGGAPLYVSSWSYYGGSQPVRAVNAAVVAGAARTASATGTYAHLVYRPVNGTVLQDATAGAYYAVTNGVAAATGTPSGAYTVVGHSAITQAGQTSPWDHLVVASS